MAKWVIDSSNVTDDIPIVQGPFGVQHTERCFVEWVKPLGEIPARITRIFPLQCLDGLDAFTPFAVLEDSSFEGLTATFQATMRMFERPIRIEIGVMLDGEVGPGNWQPRGGKRTTVTLELSPGVEPPEPAPEPPGANIIVVPHSGNTLRIAGDCEFDWIFDRHVFVEPIEDVSNVVIAPGKSFSRHPQDPYQGPTVKCRILRDGSGIQCAVLGTRRHTQYVLTAVVNGSPKVLYLRTSL